jgi:TolB-like protein/DNA-binding winged helix-turn-helix (wHTH) protein/Flp pilus assembly protein TadD
MPASTSTAEVFRFGIFELDAQSGELRRHGVKVRLPEQSFQILRVLLDRPDELVTREELRQRLWTSDTFVDFDVGLNSAIRKLRDALDDSADNPTFIETLPRRGYRFIAPVKPSTTGPIPAQAATEATTPAARLRRWWMAGALVLATIATLVVIYERAPVAERIQSLAVLPFENLTGDPAQEYFVDGMTDALTTELAQLGGLEVISRTSAAQYKGTNKLLPAIGRELNVDALLEGSIARSGQHVRISAQLIHAATDRHVWARSYEGEMSDVVALQRQIARTIATAVGGRLASPMAAPARKTQAVNPDAYDAYLKGLAVAERDTYDGNRNAVAYFEEAVARQPDFALAYAAMAQAQFQFLFGGPLSPREAIPKAEAAARKALELDETLAQAHRTLGAILRDFYWQGEAADKEFRRARELGFNIAETPDRSEQAIARAERARKLDPLSFDAYMSVAFAYRAAGQYDRAIAEFRRALEITAGHPRAHFQIGATYMTMHRLNDAIGEFETAVASSQGNPRFKAYLGYAYAAAGRRLDARKIVYELESLSREQYVSAFGIALIYDALGQKSPALAAFERAYQDRAVEFAQISQYPPFTTIASDPRFEGPMRLIRTRR